ncbi:MAG TPA: hypothetical protein VFC86_02685 [Planctomycetota bacterium]|nr:hypothetical protein [Planctomycetota bacterium]
MKYLLVASILVAGSCSKPSAPSADAARACARRHSAQSFQVLDLVSRRIEDFFGRRQPGVDAFSEELFGLRGKWRALFWSREDFETHVRRRFQARVFRPEDFEREVVEAVREDLVFAIEASEAGLAADLNGWARASREGVRTTDVKPELSRMVASLVVKDLGLNVASIAGSEVAALAASAILTRAGVFGASVAAGAGTSWMTMGISLIVGTIVGIVIDAVIGDELEDTARETIRFEMDALRRKMMESEDGLWRAARRALEAHGRALERSAGLLTEGSGHDAVRL